MSIKDERHRVTLSGPTMGTRYSCVFHADRPEGHESLAQALYLAVAEVDAVMSNWKPESDLNRFNRTAPGQWCAVPAILIRVLECALKVETDSCGAFDIGVAREVATWGFGPEAAISLPVDYLLQGRPATRSVLEIDSANHRIRKHAALSLDLCGIAKGFGADRLGETMTAAGVASWLVGIDGDMRGRGTKPDGTGWAVGHERPVPGRREIMGVIELTDLAIATSGTYRHFRTHGATTVSHTIDPATGRPVSGRVASSTVLAATCMEADAWATACLVDGHWPPRRFSPPAGLEVILTAE